MNLTPENLLTKMFFAAVSEADPFKKIPQYLPQNLKADNIYVIGAGKASAAMAKAVENYYKDIPLSGVVITRYGHKTDCKNINIIEASHPVPDDNGQEAARQILKIVKNANPNDLIIGLFSGGGSALLALPSDGISFDEKRNITKELLKSGADIASMNCVRKHLSAIKGGHLAAFCKAPMLNLFISDVTGNDLSVIASGPTVPDTTTCDDALKIIDKFDIKINNTIRQQLKDGKLETPKADNICFKTVKNQIIASPFASLASAAKIAEEQNLTVINLGDYIEGESKDVAKVIAGIALSIKFNYNPIKPPCVIISGGETSVTLTGSGRGGRNSEFLISLGNQIIKYPEMVNSFYAIACDTDGIDGSENNAGALWTPETSKKALDNYSFFSSSIINNDSYSFFKNTNDLIITNPTLTNVNDFRAVYIC
ncbi:MAG: glycerate kinase [Alphaproteobacteria bacterium]